MYITVCKYLGAGGEGLRYEKGIPGRTLMKGNHDYQVQIKKLLHNKWSC